MQSLNPTCYIFPFINNIILVFHKDILIVKIIEKAGKTWKKRLYIATGTMMFRDIPSTVVLNRDPQLSLEQELEMEQI